MAKGLKRRSLKGNDEKLRVVPTFNTIEGAVDMMMENLKKDDDRSIISLGFGDPSVFPCFRTTALAEDAIVDAVRSAKLNGYAPTAGILPARRAIAEYLSSDLPYQLSENDVYITSGCTHAIEIIISVLARSGANILLPRPGYPIYEARAAFSNLEVRHFDLVPEKGWEIDLDAVEALADENTTAMLIINPGSPCGNVFSYHHLKKVVETARKLGIFVIADEVFGHLTYGNKPFVPLAQFGSIAPVLTLGSLSKRWILPGWRLGWIVTSDPECKLKKSGIAEGIKNYLDISTSPATFSQGAIPEILENIKEDYFSNIINTIKEAIEIFDSKMEEIPCISCPQKPEGCMSVMVKLNLSTLQGIRDDIDFCLKLAKEESVIVLPGVVVGLKNWLRINFAVEPTCLEEGLARMKAFYQRHAKTQ